MKRRAVIVSIAAFAAGIAVAATFPLDFFSRANDHDHAAGAEKKAAVLTPSELLLDSRLADLEGKQSTLREHLRGKTLVNFWASWCSPCLREMPLIDEMATQSGAKVIGIAIDDPRAAKSFLAQNPVSYDIFVVKSYIFKFFSDIGNENGVLPFSVLLGEDGEIYAQKIGEFDSVADVEDFWRDKGEKI